jgi:signal transduction histidine kinase/CheY-like chemotaxis protein/PAS domain-containing protein
MSTNKHDGEAATPDFLSGGGEMGALMRAHDWSDSSLGPPPLWPQSLRTVVRLMLNTGHPMYVFWGTDRACLYNDAYRESIGPERHPNSLGRPARGVWDEIWDIIGPQIEQVMSGGGATWHVNHLVPITRNGRREDVYWTYSYSPIDDETAPGGIGGVLVVCTETTQQILTARQLTTERDRLAQLFEQAPTFMAMLRGPEHRIEIANPGYIRLIGHRPVIGRTVADALPDAVEQGYLVLLDRVFTSGEAYTATGAKYAVQATRGGPITERVVDFVYQPIKDRDGQVTGIFVQGVDVTDRATADSALRETSARLRLLDDIGEATRMATDPRSIMQATTRLLGEHMGTMRCAYADVEPDHDWFTIRDDWTAPGYAASVGGYSLAAFGARAVAELRLGRALVIRDVDRELTPADGGDTFSALQIKAIVCCPLLKADGLRGLMAVHAAAPRDWSASEIALIQAVGERSWAHVERVRANDALVASETRFREMAEKLSDANRLKDEFLATLAHELRNPLAPIRNALELMKLAPDDGSVALAARDVMGRQLTQIVRLIDDLLDLSRVSRGIVELRRSRLRLAAVLRDAIETSRPLIEEFGHALIVALPEEELVLEADPTRLVQVFANLLNNAAKFTPPGGRIELSLARAEDETVVVSVRDNGMGIPRPMLDRVFDMFTQVDRSHTQIGGGLGIGLTLVRRLVEMHGGRVEARSNGSGAGSEFLVRLPLAPATGPLGEAHESPPSPQKQPTEGRRIVVADDNIDAAESLAMMLNLLGHETRTAHDGEEALAIAREFRPEVMVLDIAMPGLDGHDLARSVRAETWGRNVLLIAASGWGLPEHKQQSRDAGFDHHVVKPIEFATLNNLLRERSRR